METISMKQKAEFINYVADFYADGGLYPMGVSEGDIAKALQERLKRHSDLPFDGDTTDRELVRDIMLEDSDIALKAKVYEKIEEVYRLAEQHYQRSFTQPPVVFSERMTRCAGKASSKWNSVLGQYSPSKLTFGIKFLREHTEEVLNNTVAHEIAHLIAIELYGEEGRGHGSEWKSVMRALGVPAEIYHDMKLSCNNNKPTVHCKCSSHVVSKITYNRIRDGLRLFRCKSCGGKVRA